MSLAVLLVGLLAGAGCVGPSRTRSDYQRKVANSAQAVASAVESALLTVEVAGDGRATAAFVALRLSESEDSASAVQTGFAAVQPPDPDQDRLRGETLSVIGKALDVLEELRLAAYRDEHGSLAEIARGLDEPLKRLRELMEIAPT